MLARAQLGRTCFRAHSQLGVSSSRTGGLRASVPCQMGLSTGQHTRWHLASSERAKERRDSAAVWKPSLLATLRGDVPSLLLHCLRSNSLGPPKGKGYTKARIPGGRDLRKPFSKMPATALIRSLLERLSLATSFSLETWKGILIFFGGLSSILCSKDMKGVGRRGASVVLHTLGPPPKLRGSRTPRPPRSQH